MIIVSIVYCFTMKCIGWIHPFIARQYIQVKHCCHTVSLKLLSFFNLWLGKRFSPPPSPHPTPPPHPTVQQVTVYAKVRLRMWTKVIACVLYVCTVMQENKCTVGFKHLRSTSNVSPEEVYSGFFCAYRDFGSCQNATTGNKDATSWVILIPGRKKTIIRLLRRLCVVYKIQQESKILIFQFECRNKNHYNNRHATETTDFRVDRTNGLFTVIW